MFDSFIFLAPALPDALVARYFENCLSRCLCELRRQTRLARMIGRFGVDEELRQALLPVIYESFLQDGFRNDLPMARIDPEWSPETLSAAMDLYGVEVRKIRSPQTSAQLQNDLGAISDIAVTSAEHLAQLREAHIKARLNALRQSAKVLSADLIGLNNTSELPIEATGAATSDAPSHDAPPAEIARRPASKIHTGEAWTMATLEAQFDAIRKPAQNAAQGSWTGDIPSIFWRAAHFNSMTDKVMKQRGSDIRRFMLITGLTDVAEITQAHLTHWSDRLQSFPKTFLRSEKDAHRNLQEILLGANTLPPSERGLSAGTMRRHVKSIEILLERARAEGVPLQLLDPTKIKPKKPSSRRKHLARAVFKLDEVRTLFRHTIWTGSKSNGRRHDAGDLIIKDGKYWIPPILAYTGARRSEIAGMLAEDVRVIDGIPAFVIQSNCYRGIKGEPKDAKEEERLTRIVPMHSQLIDLGFLDYAEAARAQGRHPLLFPDVVPKPRKGSPRSTANDLALLVDKFGESFDDAWQKAFRIMLEGNPRNLCIHSLRHYVNHTLLHAQGVEAVTRIDILGHVGSDQKENTNTSTYRDETPLEIKRAAIERLPRLL